MASSIYTGLIFFTLVHLGLAYSIWGPKSEQEATLDAALDILKSVNRNLTTSNIDEESKLLASKLLTLFKQVHGIQTQMMEIVRDDPARYVAEAINILVYRSNDLKLERAEQEVYKSYGLYLNDYLNFLDREILPHEIKSFIREALELDNKESFEHSQVMSNFFKMFISQSKNTLSSYFENFPSPTAFLNELLKRNQRNEWNAFMMMTTAYKLRSLESNDNNYLKEFKRLRKQLMDKLAIHEAKFDEARNMARTKEMIALSLISSHS